MKIFTLRKKLSVIAVIVMSFCSSSVFADEFPTLNELYGRYVFNGTLTSEAEEAGESRIEPAAETGYTVVVIPGAEDNTVQVLGFFGYGGGFTATYNESEGKLTFSKNNFFLCGVFSYMASEGVMAYVDAGMENDNETPKTLDYVFNVSKEGGNVVITATNDMVAKVMAYTERGPERDTWTYSAGYTLTMNSNNIPVSEAEGVYEFKSDNLVDIFIDDVSEKFDLTVTAKDAGKVVISGLFGLPDEIEADYQADGGIIILPSDFTFSNGTFTGSREGTAEYYNADAVNRQDAAPYLLVGESGLVTPSSFILNGEFDDNLYMTLSFSFIGGTATKKTTEGIDNILSQGQLSIKTAPASIIVTTDGKETVTVYNAQGATIGRTNAYTARFDGLAAGLYFVNAGNDTVKVLVK